MVALMIAFSFIVVIYLMNLLIGLLNMAIDNDRKFYLAQKAEVGKKQLVKYFKTFFSIKYQ